MYIRIEFFGQNRTTSTGIDVKDFEEARPFLMLMETFAQHMDVRMHWYFPEIKQKEL